MDPNFEPRPGESVAYAGPGMVIIGATLFLYGLVYPYLEVWREKKLEKDIHCPHCGKFIPVSKFPKKQEQ